MKNNDSWAISSYNSVYDKRSRITADRVNFPIYFCSYTLWKTVIGKNNQYIGDNI